MICDLPAIRLGVARCIFPMILLSGVCQLVFLSKLPCSLHWRLFISLSKQNGYTGGAQIPFFLWDSAGRAVWALGLCTHSTWCGCAWALPGSDDFIQKRKLSLRMDKYILSLSGETILCSLVSTAHWSRVNQSLRSSLCIRQFPGVCVCWHTYAIKVICQQESNK